MTLLLCEIRYLQLSNVEIKFVVLHCCYNQMCEILIAMNAFWYTEFLVNF